MLSYANRRRFMMTDVDPWNSENVGKIFRVGNTADAPKNG